MKPRKGSLRHWLMTAPIGAVRWDEGGTKRQQAISAELARCPVKIRVRRHGFVAVCPYTLETVRLTRTVIEERKGSHA